uniref:Protein phosphatase 1, regulatory subunit 3A n=1 Tax=Nothobranchius korthausae TaxID=1143690 RepID=A0A1A8FUH5_9TELE
MSFLTIPSQEGLFTGTNADTSAEEAAARADADSINDDEDEEDDTEDARLIPRCSPTPRKRGASIYDETAEYLRSHLALSAGKRVSFSDTTGGDLVDVREFHAFDSDEEENGAKWEEEEAKYRKPERAPSYHVHPEFQAPEGSLLLQAVRSNKVEVEHICPSEDDPLAFSGLIRVLNVSFHKAVYIRSTMDKWASYFDYPAEYVQGSNDGDTDQFSFTLCFTPPYTTHGSRTEFVVRYETSDGDYWANNSSLNYAVTLLLSYEDEKDDPAQTEVNAQQRRSILKHPKVFSLNDELASEGQDEEEGEPESPESGLLRPTSVRPVFIQPEIDVETAVQPPDYEPPFVDSTQSTHTVFPGEPCMSSDTDLQTNSPFVAFAVESVQLDAARASPVLQDESLNVPEQSVTSAPSTFLPASTFALQESQQRSDESQYARGANPASEASALRPSVAEMKLLSAAGEEGLPKPPLPAEGFSCISETEGIAAGWSELTNQGSTPSAAHYTDSTPEPPSLAERTVVYTGAEPPFTELTGSPSTSTRSTAVSLDTASQHASPRKDEGRTSQDGVVETKPDTLSGVGSESDINMNLTPCVFFLSGVVSLSVVMQEPSALFFIGLLLVLHRL